MKNSRIVLMVYISKIAVGKFRSMQYDRVQTQFFRRMLPLPMLPQAMKPRAMVPEALRPQATPAQARPARPARPAKPSTLRIRRARKQVRLSGQDVLDAVRTKLQPVTMFSRRTA
jgi:hypothetical protein